MGEQTGIMEWLQSTPLPPKGTTSTSRALHVFDIYSTRSKVSVKIPHNYLELVTETFDKGLY